MTLYSKTLTASGEIAGAFSVEEILPVALSFITSDMTATLQRSLDEGVNWVEVETFSASAARNVEGPGQYRVLATSAGTATVQVLRG